MRVRYAMRAFVILLLCALSVSSVPAQQRGSDARLTALAGPDAKLLLLFFVASDCPVSNRYFPEMERMSAEFAVRHVSTRYVYPNPEETAAGLAAHQRSFNAPVDAATLDPQDLLVHRTGVTTTPEAALLVRDTSGWKVVYRGRVDDRYVHFGVERAKAEHHDTEVAVQAALAGAAVPQPGGPPVGCAIVPAVMGREGSK